MSLGHGHGLHHGSYICTGTDHTLAFVAPPLIVDAWTSDDVLFDERCYDVNGGAEKTGALLLVVVDAVPAPRSCCSLSTSSSSPSSTPW